VEKSYVYDVIVYYFITLLVRCKPAHALFNRDAVRSAGLVKTVVMRPGSPICFKRKLETYFFGLTFNCKLYRDIFS